MCGFITVRFRMVELSLRSCGLLVPFVSPWGGSLIRPIVALCVFVSLHTILSVSRTLSLKLLKSFFPWLQHLTSYRRKGKFLRNASLSPDQGVH